MKLIKLLLYLVAIYFCYQLVDLLVFREGSAALEQVVAFSNCDSITICIYAILFTIVAEALYAVIYELGRIPSGIATGYSFAVFSIYKWVLMKDSDGLRIKTLLMPNSMVRLLMVPPAGKERVPYFWYHAGGCLAILVTFLVSVFLMRSCHIPFILFVFLMVMAVLGLLVFFRKSIPLVTQRKYANAFYHSATFIGEAARGVRPKDMTQDIFVDKPLDDMNNIYDWSDKFCYLYLQEDLGNYEQAKVLAEEMYSCHDKLPVSFRNELLCHRVILEIMTTNRREVVEELWTDEVEACIKKMVKGGGIYPITLYAYELLHNNDEAAAAEYKEYLYEDYYEGAGLIKLAQDMAQHIDNIAKAKQE